MNPLLLIGIICVGLGLLPREAKTDTVKNDDAKSVPTPEKPAKLDETHETDKSDNSNLDSDRRSTDSDSS